MRRLTLHTAFNTGRGYTNEGQRIAVWLVEYEGAKAWAMRDFDRGIDYVFEFEDVQNERQLRNYVMTCYDHHRRIVSGAYPLTRWVQDQMNTTPRPAAFPLYHHSEYFL